MTRISDSGPAAELRRPGADADTTPARRDREPSGAQADAADTSREDPQMVLWGRCGYVPESRTHEEPQP